jgi:hypothetical protein
MIGTKIFLSSGSDPHPPQRSVLKFSWKRTRIIEKLKTERCGGWGSEPDERNIFVPIMHLLNLNYLFAFISLCNVIMDVWCMGWVAFRVQFMGIRY